MSEVSERYKRLSDAFAAKIAAVPADKWSSPSPCSEWTARDVVRHVVSTQGMFLGFVGREIGEIPSVDDDPAGAWDAARAQVQAVLDDPERASQEFDGITGRSTFEAAVGRFLCMDLVVHGWDLARSAGLDERIAPEDVGRVR
ncbi:MAG TPA: TIGR03086 family metal-binding protein, partial [Acidimicrobiales bacterium]|nr:TIGR03086 family metal-binding protein [Acidimicrobiales bacterium]